MTRRNDSITEPAGPVEFDDALANPPAPPAPAEGFVRVSQVIDGEVHVADVPVDALGLYEARNWLLVGPGDSTREHPDDPEAVIPLPE
jgi:hypothetical protein